MIKEINNLILNTEKKYLPLAFIIALYPILVTTVNHAGAILFLALLIPAVIFGWSEWKNTFRWEKNILIGLLLFCLCVSLSLINTQDMGNGLKQLGRYIHFPLVIPIYLLLRKSRINAAAYFFTGVLLTSAVVFVTAIYQSVWLEMPRAIGAYNPLIFGNIAMLIAVIEFCMLITISSNWRQHVVIAAAIVMALTASILSGTKGAWLVLPAITIWLLWLYRKSLGNKRLLIVACSAVLLLWAGLQLKPVSDRVDIAVKDYQAYKADPTKTGSIAARTEMWSDSIDIWKAHPVIGTGIGDFKIDRQKLVDQGQSNLSIPYGHAHSIYFDILAKAGIVGLAALIFFVLIMPFITFNKFWINNNDKWTKCFSLTGMAVVLTFSVFGLTEGLLARNVFVRSYLIILIILFSGIALSIMNGRNNNA